MQKDIIIEIGLVIVMFLIGFAAGISSGANLVRKEALQHGYAEYSRTTGEWQWKDEATIE